MAITLDSMVLNTTLSQQSRITSSIKADQATGAFDLASQRIGQQVSTTNVQLSAFGQIKSSFVDIQSAAKSLSAPGKTSTTEDITKAVQTFASAYNNATSTVNTALTGDGKSPGALAGNALANLTSFDLKRVVTSGTNTADLKKIGVNANKDGTLSVDTKALQSAVQDTLAKVGAQAGQVSQKELASNGNVGSSVNTLSTRANYLTAQATAQQKLATDSQNAVLQQSSIVNNNAASGIAAYMQMFYF